MCPVRPKLKVILQYDLEKQLVLFSRDEVIAWLSQRGMPWNADLQFRQQVSMNIAGVVKRIDTLGCKIEREQVMIILKNFCTTGSNIFTQALETPTTPAPSSVPVVWTVIKLIGVATDPVNIMKMTEIYMPWF